MKPVARNLSAIFRFLPLFNTFPGRRLSPGFGSEPGNGCIVKRDAEMPLHGRVSEFFTVLESRIMHQLQVVMLNIIYRRANTSRFFTIRGRYDHPFMTVLPEKQRC